MPGTPDILARSRSFGAQQGLTISSDGENCSNLAINCRPVKGSSWESPTEQSGSTSARAESSDADLSAPLSSVKRGLSLSNLLQLPSSTLVTRTFSHVSLCSAESGTRRPQRTISQVTLTLKKLTPTDSSSSSSHDELEDVRPKRRYKQHNQKR